MTKTLGVSLLALMLSSSAHAQQIGDVFYLALENHNFTQPSSAPAGTPEQLLGDPAASFLNSLVTPGNPNAAYTSYATNYQNVSPTLHPSEPNYVYQVSGTTGPLNDSDPYPNNIVTAPNLGQLLQQKYGAAGWKSYQEDVDLVPNSGTVNQPGANSLTSTVAPQSQWTVPTSSFSGTSASYTNPYNGSHQYNYAAKHNPFVFFPSTNGGSTTAPDTSPSNPETPYYAPLQQLQTDLNDNTVAKFNWITPDQYNDMHSSLNTNFTYNGVTYQAGTDQEAVALGDNFLSQDRARDRGVPGFPGQRRDRDLERRDRGRLDRRLHRRLLRHGDRHLEAGCGQRLFGRYPVHPRVRPRALGRTFSGCRGRMDTSAGPAARPISAPCSSRASFPPRFRRPAPGP